MTAVDPPLHREDGPTCVRAVFDRPGLGNPVDARLLRHLLGALSVPRPLPLVLGGGTVFSIGADLDELAGMSGADARDWSLLGQQVGGMIAHWPAPTLALVSGPCVGPALELALNCDVIACEPRSLFAMPGLALGLLPAFDGLTGLTARGPQLVQRLFLDGEVLDAAAAAKARLVDRILQNPDDLAEIMLRLSDWPPGAVAAVRSLRHIHHQRPADAARLFAAPFASGVPQRRMRRMRLA